MRPRAGLALVLWLAGGPASGAPRVLVWLPTGAPKLQPEVRRAFSWPGALTILSADTVAERFPPSAQSREQAESESRLEAMVRAAEASFAALRLEEAARESADAAAFLEDLAPTVRREQAFARLYLLKGRIELARKDARGFAAAIGRAAEAAVSVELDEAEYPPLVRQAFLAARAKVQARPSRALRVQSAPADAEIEINGRLVGRTPASAELPPGRCFLSVARAGYEPHLSACPSQEAAEIALERATREALRDQLRERLSADPAWYLEPLLLETLAAEEGARWIVALERDRGGGLKALVYSAAERALRPIEPSRYADGEIDKLSAVISELIKIAEKLAARAVETPTGVPALEAQTADPDVASAAAFLRRPGEERYERLALTPRGDGRFAAALPLGLSSEGRWDLEFFVEAYDQQGSPSGRSGEAARPLRYQRGPLAAPAAAPAWYTRWYVWTGVGVVAAGAAAAGTYYALRPTEVSITFGRNK
jgi:hypothetical protein